MMLGLLLARANVEVVVLEKHADFLRDFRGDTIHPSTLEVMKELGLLDGLLERPHQEVAELRGQIGGIEVTLADFRHLQSTCRFIALMPQWDFLDFLASHARRYKNFRLAMRSEVTDLIEANGSIVGVRAKTPEGQLDVRADLTIGADGRDSVVRTRAGLDVRDLGAPIDVLWMRFSRLDSDPQVPLGRVERGRILVLIYRGDYWQCGFVIPKGAADEIRARGLNALRDEIALVAPFLRERVGELRTWDDVKVLTVKLDRLTRWYRPGLLCIGDAAHAMSPIGGVGINLAIQDAVAAANVLAAPLREHAVAIDHLQKVETRRMRATRLTQGIQKFIQDRVIKAFIEDKENENAPTQGKRTTLPWPLRLFRRFPILRRLPARLVGIGFQPEHVRTG